MSKSVMLDSATNFAISIVNLSKDVNECIMTKQLVRSATSVGANIHESKYAYGTADFVYKMQIALKECYETEYWLLLLYKTNYIDEKIYQSLTNECGGIRRMLISSINTSKEKSTKN